MRRPYDRNQIQALVSSSALGEPLRLQNEVFSHEIERRHGDSCLPTCLFGVLNLLMFTSLTDFALRASIKEGSNQGYFYHCNNQTRVFGHEFPIPYEVGKVMILWGVLSSFAPCILAIAAYEFGKASQITPGSQAAQNDKPNYRRILAVCGLFLLVAPIAYRFTRYEYFLEAFMNSSASSSYRKSCDTKPPVIYDPENYSNYSTNALNIWCVAFAVINLAITINQWDLGKTAGRYAHTIFNHRDRDGQANIEMRAPGNRAANPVEERELERAERQSLLV